MDKIRDAFEKWIIDYLGGCGNLHKTKNDNYADYQTHDMWKAYQAGKENK